METIFGTEAIDEAQNQIQNSKNTIFYSMSWNNDGDIELMIINTFDDDITSTVIPNNRITIIEDKIDELILFEITAFFDAYVDSLSDKQLLNVGWEAKLNLLYNQEIFKIRRF